MCDLSLTARLMSHGQTMEAKQDTLLNTPCVRGYCLHLILGPDSRGHLVLTHCQTEMCRLFFAFLQRLMINLVVSVSYLNIFGEQILVICENDEQTLGTLIDIH